MNEPGRGGASGAGAYAPRHAPGGEPAPEGVPVGIAPQQQQHAHQHWPRLAHGVQQQFSVPGYGTQAGYVGGDVGLGLHQPAGFSRHLQPSHMQAQGSQYTREYPSYGSQTSFDRTYAGAYGAYPAREAQLGSKSGGTPASGTGSGGTAAMHGLRRRDNAQPTVGWSQSGASGAFASQDSDSRFHALGNLFVMLAAVKNHAAAWWKQISHDFSLARAFHLYIRPQTAIYVLMILVPCFFLLYAESPSAKSSRIAEALPDAVSKNVLSVSEALDHSASVRENVPIAGAGVNGGDRPGTAVIAPGVSSISIGPTEVETISTKGGVSLVAVCMNRHSTLEKALPSWLSVKGVEEVVVVDWSSSPPLEDKLRGTSDPRLKVVRVENEPKWVLSRAFNLGLTMATRERILRVDCDYELHPDIMAGHPLDGAQDQPLSQFYAGNWRNAKNENQIHLNGIVIVRRADFWKVLGYDERIQTYGWDDEDLYTRLEQFAGLTRMNISYDYVAHIQHDDTARAQSGVRFVEVEVDFNRVLLGKLDKWSRIMLKEEEMKPSQYDVVTSSGGYVVLRSSHRPDGLIELTPESFAREAWNTGLGRRLHDEYGTPWDVMVTMGTAQKEALLEQLMKADIERKKFSVDGGEDAEASELAPAGVVIVHVQHGLGNRLRALASGLAFARAARRGLVVVWERDSHSGALMGDLFNTTAARVCVLDKFKPRWPFQEEVKWDAAWTKVHAYNYMETEGEGSRKGEKIANEDGTLIYFKGAYKMESPLSVWQNENNALRELLPYIHPEVAKLVSAIGDVDWSTVIGVHVRNRRLTDDIDSVDPTAAYGKSATETIDEWRAKSSYQNFVPRMREEIQKKADTKFFVASDTVAVLDKLKAEFGDRIIFIPRVCDDRDVQCVRYAFADIIALSKTRFLLGSGWSSFTEAAERLGGMKVYTAGRDF